MSGADGRILRVLAAIALNYCETGSIPAESNSEVLVVEAVSAVQNPETLRVLAELIGKLRVVQL